MAGGFSIFEKLKLFLTPTQNNDATQILVRNTTDEVGALEYIDKAELIGELNIASVNDIVELENYSGSQTTLIVKDSLRGGIFNYVGIGTVDNGTIFNATGKGSGFWQRQYTQSEGRHPEWFGAKGDAVQDGFTVIGTDDSQAIQATIDSYENRNGLIQFTSSYRLSQELQLGEGTHLRGESSLGPYQVTETDTIFYKSNTALWFDAGVNGLRTTDEVVDYRNLGIKLEYLGIFSTGDLRTNYGLRLYDNPNASTGLVKPGLPVVNFCFFSGWDICVDAKDADSFDFMWSHASECRIGVITGTSEFYGYRNNFYKCDETCLELNGANDIVTGNEFEPSNLTGTSIVMGTVSKNAMISSNSFKNQDKGIVIKGSGNNNAPGSHMIIGNSFFSNSGSKYIDIEASATRIMIKNNVFISDTKNTGASNFIYAASGASRLDISGNEFTKLTGGLVNKTISADGVLDFSSYGNRHNGFTISESTPLIENTSYKAFKDEITQTTAKDWGNIINSVDSAYKLSNSDSYLSLSNLTSLFSYSGTFYVKFRTPSSYSGNQKIIGGATPRFYVQINSSGQCSITLGDNIVHAVQNNLTPDTDYELLFTYSDPDNDGNGIIQPYFNNLFVVGPFNYTGFTSLPTNMAIGRNGATDYFKGSVYDVKWFNQVFTDAEAYAFLRLPNKVNPYPAKLDLGKLKTSTVWYDQSNNGYNATNNGTIPVGGSIAESVRYLTEKKANLTTPTFIGPVTISSGGLTITGGLATDIINGTGGVTNGSTFVQTRSIGTLVPSNVAIATGDNFNVFANKTQGQINNTVKLTGNETIAGVKTFSSSPIVPTATTSTQAVNLSQVQGLIGTNGLEEVTDINATTTNLINANGGIAVNSGAKQVSLNDGDRLTYTNSGIVTKLNQNASQVLAEVAIELPIEPGTLALVSDLDLNLQEILTNGNTSNVGFSLVTPGVSNVDLSTDFIEIANSDYTHDLFLSPDNVRIVDTGSSFANSDMEITPEFIQFGGTNNIRLQAPSSVFTGTHTATFQDGSGTIAYISDIGVAGSFSGVGTATTVFTVTIGSTQPNNTYKVNATPTNLLSAAVFYITNKTTTTFDVVYLAGLTGTVEFDWSLRP